MKKRKTHLNKAVIIVASLLLSSCNGDKNAMEIVAPDNYYSGINIDKIDNLEYISHMECTDYATYAVGPLSDLVCDKVIDTYDSLSHESGSITLNFDSCYRIDFIYADDYALYIGYRDGNSYTRAGVFNRLTGEKLYDFSLSDEYNVYSVFKDSSENIYFHMVSTSGLKLDSYVEMFDKSLNYHSRINLCEKMNLPEEKKPVRILSDTNNGYYVLTLDTSNKFAPSVYRVSENFEIKYGIDDFSDMNGEIENMCLNPEGNLLIIFKDDTGKYFINEINSENGNVLERYERVFDEGTCLTGNLLNSGGQSSLKYDFYISENDGIYGYNLKDDSSEKICDNIAEQSPDCLFIENDNIFSYSSPAGDNDFVVCKIDESGDVSDCLTFENEEGYIGDIFIDDNENVYFANIIDDTEISVCNMEEKLFTLKTDENIESLHSVYADTDDIFHIGYIELGNDTDDLHLNYLVCDKSGKELLRKSYAVNSYLCGVFPSCKDNNFRIIYTDTENRFVVRSIDYRTGNESEIKHGISSDDIEEIYKGDETFDFYYSTGNSIYGYLEQQKKSEEILDWNKSQLYVNPEIVCLKNNGSLVCVTSDETGLAKNICFLNKADKETVEKLRSRTVINFTAFDITENLRKAVNRYNNSNTEYLINLNYRNTVSGFDKAVVSGEPPDIVLWTEETDMSSYLRSGFFTDLGIYLEKDKNISSDDLLGNIYDICSKSGKTEYFLLDFMAEALIYDSSEWETDILTYDILCNSEREKVFYDMTGEELLEILIMDNIGEFVDFENRESHFDSDKFAAVLEFINRDAVAEKNQIVTFEDYEKANKRFEEDRCFLQKVTLSKSEICSLRNSVVSDISFFGFPTNDNMYSHIVANNLIGICEKSVNKDAAWDFVSFLLADSYQDSISNEINGLFPVNKKSFEKARQSMYDDKNNDIVNMIFDYAKNGCNSVIDEDYIYHIVKEQTGMFFEGIQNIDDTAENIDNKVKIYLSEIN